MLIAEVVFSQSLLLCLFFPKERTVMATGLGFSRCNSRGIFRRSDSRGIDQSGDSDVHICGTGDRIVDIQNRSIFGERFSFWNHNNRLGAAIAVTVTGAQIAAVGVAVAIGLGIVLAKHWERGPWPGDDLTVSPDDDFEWRGNEPVG